jgi:hypothetical protein
MQRTQVLSGERLAVTLQGYMPQWMAKIHEANEQYYQGKDLNYRILLVLKPSIFHQKVVVEVTPWGNLDGLPTAMDASGHM